MPEDELRRLQVKYKVNQSGLALMLNISKGRMSEIFTGDKRLPIAGIRLAVSLGANAEIMLMKFKCELNN